MRTVFSAAAVAVVLASAAPVQAEIGVLAAVNRDMTGARPSEAARPVFINEKLVTDERIETSANGGGQVLFLDQTSLTIAPNSSIVLDRYVYDPDSQSGDISLTVARGALRLVGGRITKTSDATIKTPSATIGIRGGMGSVNVGDSETFYIHVAGFSSTIKTALDSLTITREGGLARIGGDGGLEFLGVATPDLIAAAFGAASSGKGGGGGSVSGAAARSGGDAVGQQVSGADDALDAAPISTAGEKQNAGFGDLTVDLNPEPEQQFAESTVQETVMDDLPLNADALGFVGFYDGSMVVDVLDGTQTFAIEQSPITLALSLSNGNGAASIIVPFDIGGTDQNGNPVGEFGELVAFRGDGVIFNAAGQTAFSGTPSGVIELTDDLADGSVGINYSPIGGLQNPQSMQTLLSVDAQFQLTANPNIPAREAQDFADFTVDLLAPSGP